MPNEIKYDFTDIDNAIKEIKSLKTDMSVMKKVNSQFDFLFTGKSKGNMLDALVSIYSDAEQRAKQIKILLDNVYNLLKNARDQMSNTDNSLAKEYNKNG